MNTLFVLRNLCNCANCLKFRLSPNTFKRNFDLIFVRDGFHLLNPFINNKMTFINRFATLTFKPFYHCP